MNRQIRGLGVLLVALFLAIFVQLNFLQVVREVFRKACWIVGTNILEPAKLSDKALIGTYKDQGGVDVARVHPRQGWMLEVGLDIGPALDP